MKKIDNAVRLAMIQCLAIKPDETVLVATDQSNLECGQLFYRGAKLLGNEAVLMVMPDRANNGQEPPVEVAAALRASRVAFLATTKSLSHTQARKEASRAGCRIASMPGISREMMGRALEVNYREMADRGQKISKVLCRASQVRIVTDLGTDLSFSVLGRRAEIDTGIIPRPGGFTNLPAGEVYLAPVEGTAQGRLVVDGAIGNSGVLRKPIAIAISDGYAVGMTGGRAAQNLWDMLSQHGQEAFNVAEFGIGINPKAIVTGNILEDEKALGTIHIAFGDNSGFGGRVSVPSHQDGIVNRPSVWVDGRCLMDHGKLLV